MLHYFYVGKYTVWYVFYLRNVMNPKSHTLFHFTKTNSTLKLALKNGFWPRYCLEDVRWLTLKDTEFIGYPMVCFCDIPLSRVDEHVKFYGNFGIGLTKEWALSNGLTPVQYIANSSIPETFKRLTHVVGEHGDELADAGWSLIRFLLAHAKPIEGNMVVSNSLVSKEFIQESEWRYIPRNQLIQDHLSRSDFEDEAILQANNDLTRNNCMLKFTPKDIKYIFVKSDSDIPDIINFIQTELDHYPSSDIKVLMSRVTSLESISIDI